MAELWDEFVANSRNSTFLLNRGYMDYHSDRFRDASLMAFEGDSLLALLPANIADGGIVYSHQGLTYGGWLLPQRHLDMPDYMQMWNQWLEFCRKENYKGIVYTPIPSIYARQPSEEDRYMLFRSEAQLKKRQISSTIDLNCNPGFNKLQRRHLKKASTRDVIFAETEDISGFSDMLVACLRERHGCMPVHTADELRLLKERFPANIRFFAASDADGMQAGVCVYVTGKVAHAQYIATTAAGRSENLLSLVFDRLINDIFAERSYFDFGISTEDGGLSLNEGLARQKCSYGGSGTVYDSYFIPL